MGGSGVVIDVGSVRLGVDHIGFGSQSIKYGFRDIPGTSVGTVQTNLNAFERIHTKRNQITDIAISSCHIVHRTSDPVFMSIWYFFISFTKYFYFSVQIVFYESDGLFIHLFSVSIDQFDSIIIIWVMTGGDHDSAVKIIGSCHIGNGWGCGYMKQVCICPGSYQTTYQCVFKHIAGSPGIFSDYAPCRCIIPVSAFLFSVVPAQESADFVCVVCS